MMIENSCSKNSKKAIDFRDLYDGQIFIYREIPYMKLSEEYENTLSCANDETFTTRLNAINLKLGYLCSFQERAKVIPVKAKLCIN